MKDTEEVDMIKQEFAKRLRVLIKEQDDLTLEKLAEYVGSTKSAMSRYWNGRMEPGLSIMIKLAAYFGVTLDWLAGNGPIESIERTGAEKYDSVVEKCIQENVSPEKLNSMIDVLTK